MKRILWIFSSLLLLTTVILNSGCQDDPTGTDLNPLVQITAGPTPGNTITELGDTVSVTIEVTKGTNTLSTLTILEDGTKISDLSRLEFVGQQGAANPFLLISGNENGFTWDINIKVHEVYETHTYTFEVADEKGLKGSADFDLTIVEPLEMDITGVLWNQAGPVGNGGIDLDDGSTTGTAPHINDPNDTYLRAEMRDMGLDSNAVSGDNWERRIGSMNGTEIRFVGNSLPDFDFSTVSTKEAVVTAFDAAAPFTETLPAFTIVVSAKVQEGDIFAVKRDDSRYYLVKVDKITETLTLGNNDDNYEVSIKY
jgi:hypothetical protein